MIELILSELVFYCPFDKGLAESAVIALIDSAKQEIHGNAYGLTDPQFCDALIRAKVRGVEVVFTVDKTQAAGRAAKPLIKKMKNAGIEVLEGKSPVKNQLLHLKSFEVDKVTLEEGSWNYSPSASQQFNVVNISDSPMHVNMFIDNWNKIYKYLKGRQK
jgi:phosphatidylserine/phosphatidylglycerophosphate/cardiolipin synthase-like enzyme